MAYTTGIRLELCWITACGTILVASVVAAQNATLLSTIPNPTPAAKDYFGCAVAALGADRVLAGAYGEDPPSANVGVAYLLSTNGTRLITFTNPAPASYDYFGFALAAAGSDCVIIGAYQDDLVAMDSGTAYLYRSTGARLVTLTNPTPALNDWFGFAVNGVGSQHVVIGAPNDDTGMTDAGVAHLFHTNGVRLVTFTNPAPASADHFGRSVAAIGADRVLIGAPYDDAGATDAGAAYLFSTNGRLLTTFTNPTPAVGSLFGYSLAAASPDRLLISAPYDDTGATNAGAINLFRADGVLLTTMTNPTPAADDCFGGALAAAADRVIIGCHQDDRSSIDAGVVYVFSVPAGMDTLLGIQLTVSNTVAITWPSPSTGWALQVNTNGVADVNWSNVTSGIADDGKTKSLIVNPPGRMRFYRLMKP